MSDRKRNTIISWLLSFVLLSNQSCNDGLVPYICSNAGNSNIFFSQAKFKFWKRFILRSSGYKMHFRHDQHVQFKGGKKISILIASFTPQNSYMSQTVAAFTDRISSVVHLLFTQLNTGCKFSWHRQVVNILFIAPN